MKQNKQEQMKPLLSNDKPDFIENKEIRDKIADAFGWGINYQPPGSVRLAEFIQNIISQSRQEAVEEGIKLGKQMVIEAIARKIGLMAITISGESELNEWIEKYADIKSLSLKDKQ